MVAGGLMALVAGLVAAAVTWLVLRNAAVLGLVQPPNERSSHTTPTPTGGGLGIVAGGTIAGIAAAMLGAPEVWPVLALSLAVAALGFLDDRRPVPALLRLPVQVLLVGIAVALVPATPLMAALGLGLPWPLLLAGLTVAAAYWLNIFNFMDGIDGIAGTQAVFMLLAAVLLVAPGSGQAPLDHPLLWWMVAVTAATAGFLVFNWPPARIFMGDAGSTWLGFVIAFLALITVANGWLTPWQWLILGTMFLADATITLLRRLLRREPIFSAHRLHAYQHLSRRWGNHRRVTLLYLAVNVILLLPLALWAGIHPAAAPVAVALAYLPVAAGLVWAGAGTPEPAST